MGRAESLESVLDKARVHYHYHYLVCVVWYGARHVLQCVTIRAANGTSRMFFSEWGRLLLKSHILVESTYYRFDN